MLLGNLRVVTHSGTNCAHNYPVFRGVLTLFVRFFSVGAETPFLHFRWAKFHCKLTAEGIWQQRKWNKQLHALIEDNSSWWNLPTHLESQPIGNFEWFFSLSSSVMEFLQIPCFGQLVCVDAVTHVDCLALVVFPPEKDREKHAVVQLT